MKNKMKYVSLVMSVLLLVGILTGCGGSGKSLEEIQKKGTIVVATSPDFPPFEYLDGGKVVGIEIDILEKIAQDLGVTLTIEQMDFDAVVPGVQVGKFDLGASGITANEKRKKNVDFSEAYFLASQAIVVMPDSTITSKADLEGKTVSVQTGTTAEEYCMNNGYEVLAFTANNDALAALTAGKVDAWVVDNEVAVTLAEKNGLVVLDEPMTTEPYAFAFPKGSDSLIEAFDQSLSAMLKDGTVEEIFKNYDALYVSPVK